MSPPARTFAFFFNGPAPTEIYTLSLTTLFRSRRPRLALARSIHTLAVHHGWPRCCWDDRSAGSSPSPLGRSEEHTSELQSHSDLVCRLLLEKKKKNR